MASASHVCAGTAPAASRNDAARLKALALAALVEHPAAASVRVDELVAAAAHVAPAQPAGNADVLELRCAQHA